MSRPRILLTVAALALAPAAFGQQTLALPSISLAPLSPTPSLTLPPINIPRPPPLPVIPVGPRLQGEIPITYQKTGLIIYYDTQSPYPVQWQLTGIVSPAAAAP